MQNTAYFFPVSEYRKLKKKKKLMLKGYFLLERSYQVARLVYQTKAPKTSFHLQPTSVSDYQKLFFFRFYEAIRKKQLKDIF